MAKAQQFKISLELIDDDHLRKIAEVSNRLTSKPRVAEQAVSLALILLDASGLMDCEFDRLLPWVMRKIGFADGLESGPKSSLILGLDEPDRPENSLILGQIDETTEIPPINRDAPAPAPARAVKDLINLRIKSTPLPLKNDETVLTNPDQQSSPPKKQLRPRTPKPDLLSEKQKREVIDYFMAVHQPGERPSAQDYRVHGQRLERFAEKYLKQFPGENIVADMLGMVDMVEGWSPKIPRRFNIIFQYGKNTLKEEDKLLVRMENLSQWRAKQTPKQKKAAARTVHICPAAGCGEPLDYPGQRCPRCGQ